MRAILDFHPSAHGRHPDVVLLGLCPLSVEVNSAAPRVLRFRDGCGHSFVCQTAVNLKPISDVADTCAPRVDPASVRSGSRGVPAH
jgi:hypothetical protein